MDILTHAMTGLIFAAPFAVSHPTMAVGIAVGSVLPDLDAFSRIGGKLSFLRWHQTVSHSVFGLIGYGLIGSLLAEIITPGAWCVGVGLAAGAFLHVILDITNTYGIAVFAPFSNRRFCFEWVFFIDGAFIAACAVCLVLLGRDLTRTGLMGANVTVMWFSIFVSGYLIIRAVLRRIAIRRSGLRLDAMVPSALWPWVWHGFVSEFQSVRVIRVDLIFGVRRESVKTFDDRYIESLSQSEAYRVMCELSAGYHAINVETYGEQTVVRCKDLRTRNFGGTFGDLEVVLDVSGNIIGEVFNV